MALCLSFLATSAIPAVTASAEDGNSKPKMYAVANSHLDTAWNWPLETSIQSYIPNTIKQNIELLKKYPEFNMNWEGVYRYGRPGSTPDAGSPQDRCMNTVMSTSRLRKR